MLADPDTHERAADNAAAIILTPGIPRPPGVYAAGSISSAHISATNTGGSIPAPACTVQQHETFLACLVNPLKPRHTAATASVCLDVMAPLECMLTGRGICGTHTVALRAAAAVGATAHRESLPQRHRERLHMYDIPSVITLSDLLHARVGEGFRLVDAPPSLATDGHRWVPMVNATHNDASGADGERKGSALTQCGAVVMTMCCEWLEAEAGQHLGITIEYKVRSISPPQRLPARTAALPSATNSPTRVRPEAKIARALLMAASRMDPVAPWTAAPTGASPSASSNAMRIDVSVLAPLPFWLRFERARLHRRRCNHAEYPDAAALQTFVERVRHRDRRLARLAAAACGGVREWRAALEAGALNDSILLPRLAPELTLLPRPRPLSHVTAAVSVRVAPALPRANCGGHLSATVRLQLRIGNGCASVRWAARHRLRPALAALMGVHPSDDILAHIWQSHLPGAAGAVPAPATSISVSSAPPSASVLPAAQNASNSEFLTEGRAVAEEPRTPFAMAVRLTITQSGLVTVSARGFRVALPAAREAMLGLWRLLVQRAQSEALHSDVWQASRADVSPNVRLLLTLASSTTTRAANACAADGGFGAAGEALTDGPPRALRSSVAAMSTELVMASTYEWDCEDDDGDDDGDGDGGSTHMRAAPSELSPAAWLWQQRWCWQLPSVRAAEVLLAKLVEARRSEGWWCSSPPNRCSALLCRSLLLRRACGGDSDDSAPCSALLQYGVVVMGSSIVTTFWQEPQWGAIFLHGSYASADAAFTTAGDSVGEHSKTRMGKTTLGGAALDSSVVFAHLARWLARCDGHLAGAISAVMQLRLPDAATESGRRFGYVCARNSVGVTSTAQLPTEPSLPVQHVLPHGRYYKWQLRPFDPPIHPDAVLARLNVLLQLACDGAVRFAEQACSSTSARAPVDLTPNHAGTDAGADAMPPQGLPSPRAACVVLRANSQVPSDNSSHVGLAWLAAENKRVSAHLCVCTLDDLAPPTTNDPLLLALAPAREAKPAHLLTDGERHADVRSVHSTLSTRNADRLRARFDGRLAACSAPAALESLFDNLHGGAHPSAADVAHCLGACDATQVVALPLDTALRNQKTPSALAASTRNALAAAFCAVRCTGSAASTRRGGSSVIAVPSGSAGGTTLIVVSGVWLNICTTEPAGPPLFLRIGLVTKGAAAPTEVANGVAVVPAREKRLNENDLESVLHDQFVRLRAALHRRRPRSGDADPADGRMSTHWLAVQSLQPSWRSLCNTVTSNEAMASLAARMGEATAAESLQALRIHYPLTPTTVASVHEQLQLLPKDSIAQRVIALRVASPGALPLLTNDLSRLTLPRARIYLTHVRTSAPNHVDSYRGARCNAMPCH